MSAHKSGNPSHRPETSKNASDKSDASNKRSASNEQHAGTGRQSHKNDDKRSKPTS